MPIEALSGDKLIHIIKVNKGCLSKLEAIELVRVIGRELDVIAFVVCLKGKALPILAGVPLTVPIAKVQPIAYLSIAVMHDQLWSACLQASTHYGVPFESRHQLRGF